MPSRISLALHFNSPTSQFGEYYILAPKAIWQSNTYHLAPDYDIEYAIAVQLVAEARQIDLRDPKKMQGWGTKHGGCRGYPFHGCCPFESVIPGAHHSTDGQYSVISLRLCRFLRRATTLLAVPGSDAGESCECGCPPAGRGGSHGGLGSPDRIITIPLPPMQQDQ